MSYKIIFFDVDGTITHHEDGSISDKMKETIFKLKEQGIKVAAATGRPLSLCREIEELGIDTFVLQTADMLSTVIRSSIR